MPEEEIQNPYELIRKCFEQIKQGSDNVQEQLKMIGNYTRDIKIKNMLAAIDKYMEAVEKFTEIGTNIVNGIETGTL
jgi:hypothetical protein